ncbi:hypothetical protein QAD02_022518 [Eretmocerus hayati]|uniref:Uncharacterized protein n=1 Tax=Eretmocerus hayati TaxID=131215 RepID=A0ACC2PT07_9HYME|nr:hypothetical protein QAD02_022518 [Eretmocerus hayati]
MDIILGQGSKSTLEQGPISSNVAPNQDEAARLLANQDSTLRDTQILTMSPSHSLCSSNPGNSSNMIHSIRPDGEKIGCDEEHEDMMHAEGGSIKYEEDGDEDNEEDENEENEDGQSLTYKQSDDFNIQDPLMVELESAENQVTRQEIIVLDNETTVNGVTVNLQEILLHS